MTDLFSPAQWPDKWLRYETLNEKCRFEHDRVTAYELAIRWPIAGLRDRYRRAFENAARHVGSVA